MIRFCCDCDRLLAVAVRSFADGNFCADAAAMPCRSNEFVGKQIALVGTHLGQTLGEESGIGFVPVG